MSRHEDRRLFLARAAATCGSAFAATNSMAQWGFAPAPPSPRPGSSYCPPGTDLVEFTAKSEVVGAELDVNLTVPKAGGAGGGVKGKVPTTVWTYAYKCTAPAPPPPPPPTPPKNGWYPFDLLESIMDAREMRDPYAFFVAVGLPGFVSLSNDPAKLTVLSNLANGSQAVGEFQLIRALNGYKFADPAAVDYWQRTQAVNALSGRMSLSDMQVFATASGRAKFGFAPFMGASPMVGFTGTVSTMVNASIPPKFNPS